MLACLLHHCFLHLQRGYSQVSAHRLESGLTLIEMLTVVAIIGTLAAIATPGWQGFTRRQQINQANELVYRALRSAQSEAKKHNIPWQVTFARDPADPNTIRYQVHATAEDDSVFVDPQYLQSLPAWSALTPNVTFATQANAKGKSETTIRNQNQTRWRVVFNAQGCPVYRAGDTCLQTSLRALGRIGLTTAPETVPVKAHRCIIISTVLGHVRRGEYHAKAKDSKFCY